MESRRDGSERSENANGESEQETPEHESDGQSMSRRDALKKGAYAAPAIITIGSMPGFAEDAPSCAKREDINCGNGNGDNGNGGNGNGGNGNGGNGDNGNGVGRGLNRQGEGYGSADYGSGSQEESNYGSDSYGTDGDSGDGYVSND
ncbi:hypothetical protein [Salinibacter ruber]|uniref:hypothetical protein n=1 Tax=Salinibacter ruber TaxID=146919 RepID=UPI0021697511|nr:hypothetical protein [Salinibacter ruber]MCS3698416.1 hypothetical protein [Salinibacter ruber]